MLELTRLRVFREVATRGSFTAAADALHYTQPSISNQVARLEQEIGARLIERLPRGIRLTPAGQVLLGHAEAVLVRLADAEREVAETIANGSRTIRVAAFPTASATILPPAIAAFQAAHPNVDVRLTEAEPPVALPGLLSGDYDVVLAYDYPVLAAPAPRGVDVEPLFVDQMAAALPAGHPLATRDCVTLTDLAADAWVTPHDSVCHDALLHVCRSAGFVPAVASQTNDYMAMQGLVAAGVGVAVLPRLAAAIAVRPGVVLRPLAGLVLERVTFTVTRTGSFPTPTTETFRTALRDAATTAAHPDLPLEWFDITQTSTAPSTRRTTADLAVRSRGAHATPAMRSARRPARTP